MSGDVVVRELLADELPEAWNLGRLAFGGAGGAPPAAALEIRPGLTRYGAFDRSCRLLGEATDLHHEQWWGGRLVPAADVGGVAVLPEARGRGVARALLRELLEGARERGAAISALFPTVSAVYRSAGWATVGAMSSVDLPTALLHSPHAAGGPLVRPGSPADLVAAQGLYGAIAQARNGMLSRNGPAPGPPPADLPGGVDGLTLAEHGDGLGALTIGPAPELLDYF